MPINEIKEIKEVWALFCVNHADLLRDISLALFGAVGRLASDHARYDGVNIQFAYELFRAFTMATVAVFLVNAVIAYYGVVGPVEVACAIGAGYYAQEVNDLVKGVIPTLKDRVIKTAKKNGGRDEVS